MAYQPKSYKKFIATAATATLVASAVAPAALAADFSDVTSKYKDAVDFLVSKGVNGTSATTFGTDAQIKRVDAAVMLVSVLGLNIETAPAAGFKDVPERAVKHVNALKAAGITSGKTAETFDADSNITRGELAIWIAKAFNLTAKADTTLTFKDVNARYADAVKALVSNNITSGFSADAFGVNANAKRGDFAIFLKKASETVPAVVALESVKATGAKKIEVKFNQAIDTTKAVYSVKKGTVTTNFAKVTPSEDKKSAVIEFVNNLTAGEYTVSVTGLTTDALSSKVTVEAAKLTSIEFKSDVAVIDGNNITTNLVAKNQYGEDETAKLAAGTVSATTSKGLNASVDNKGKLTVTNGAPFTVGEKVVVTVVDSATGLVATKTLTVAQAADVKTIEIGQLTTDNKDLKDAPINVTAMTTNANEYYLPVTVKDQYGNVLSADELAGVDVLSSNSNIIKLDAVKEIIDTDNGTVIVFDAADATATHGTVVLTVVSSATGVTANTTIQVKDNAKLDVVKLDVPSTELKQTVATTLPVTVTDSYGKDVALYDLAMSVNLAGNEIELGTGTKITATNATFSVETDYVNKKSVIKVTPSAQNVILTATTATGKSQNLSLVANAAPVVAGIKGVKSTFASMLANDTSLSTQLDDKLDFVDQYGNAITAPTYDSTDAANTANDLDFTIAPKSATNAVTTDVTPGTFVASTTPGTETYVVTLKKGNDVLDTEEVTVTVVDAEKIEEFGIADLNKFYTLTGSASHAQNIDIFGLVGGKKVVVNQSMAKDFYASNGLVGINTTTGAYTPQTVDTDGADKTSTVRVLVDNGVKTFTVTKDVLFSDATPKATGIDFKLGTANAEGVVQITPVTTNNIVTTGTDGLKIYATDQYGVKITTGYKFVITNNTTGNATLDIDTDGVITFTGGLTAGKSFVINVTIDGITKSIKVIVG